MDRNMHTHIMAFASGQDTAVDIAAGHMLSYEHSHEHEGPHHHIEFVPNGIHVVMPANPYLPDGDH